MSGRTYRMSSRWCRRFCAVFLSVFALSAVGVRADLIVEPPNSFYSRHREECTYLNRSAAASGDTVFWSAPDSLFRKDGPAAGERVYISFVYTDDDGLQWGLVSDENQWVLMADLLLPYTSDEFMAEHEETLKKIAVYEDILNNYDSMAAVIMEDLKKIKKEYSHPRKTAVENAAEIVYEEKKIEETQVVFLMDRFGYARTVDTSVYERNKETADAENKYVFSCMNTDKICIFTDAGRMHTAKVLDLPYGKFRDKGTPIDNVSNYDSKTEQIVLAAPLAQVKEEQICFVTGKGMVKQVEGSEFEVSKRTIAATKLGEKDKVVMVQPAAAMEHLVLQTRDGYFLKFLKEEIPVQKKNALGVRGIRMGETDLVEHAYMLENRMEYVITYREKQVTLNKLKLAKRDTKGTKIRI